MPKKVKEKEITSTNIHIRIKNTKTVELLNECFQTKSFSSYNELLNRCLEVALPQIIENNNLSGNYIKSSLKSIENKLLKKMDIEFTKIKKDLTKEMIIQNINQSMISSLLQAFLLFCETQNCPISDKMIETFSENLPQIFSDQFYELSQKLLNIEIETE